MRGRRGRHSREEVDNGGQEIVGHWDRDGGSEGCGDKGSGKNSGEGDLEGWASRLEGDLRQLGQAPDAPTVPKEIVQIVSRKIHRARVIKRPGLVWIFRKTIHHVRPAFHKLRRRCRKVLRHRCEIDRYQLSLRQRRTLSRRAVRKTWAGRRTGTTHGLGSGAVRMKRAQGQPDDGWGEEGNGDGTG